MHHRLRKAVAAASLLLAGTWTASALAQGQPKTFEVEAEPRVISGRLQIDIYIRRTTTTNFALNDANFAIGIQGAGLDVAGAVADRNAVGPWDILSDPRSYREQRLFVLEGPMLSLNVYGTTGMAASLAHLGGVGSGRTLSLTRERLCRLNIPITDPTQQVNLRWIVESMEVMDRNAVNRTPQGIFTVLQSVVSLCEPPAAPTLTAPPAPICGNSSQLTSSHSGPHIWYRNGQVISGQSGNTLTLTQSGVYSARALVGTCESNLSANVTLTVIGNAVPQIQQVVNELRLQDDGVTGTLQWFYNDRPLAGATRSTLLPSESGLYYLVRTTPCGPQRSNILTYQRPGTGAPRDTAYAVVAPNPYVESTMLTYHLVEPAQVVIEASTVSGVLVRKLFDQPMAPGTHRFPFSARNLGLAAGTYLLHIKAGSLDQTFKLVEAK